MKKQIVKYQNVASRQVSYDCGWDKWNYVLENTRIINNAELDLETADTVNAVWHLCKILSEVNVIKLSILSTSFKADIFFPLPNWDDMFLSGF